MSDDNYRDRRDPHFGPDPHRNYRRPDHHSDDHTDHNRARLQEPGQQRPPERRPPYRSPPDQQDTDRTYADRTNSQRPDPEYDRLAHESRQPVQRTPPQPNNRGAYRDDPDSSNPGTLNPQSINPSVQSSSVNYPVEFHGKTSEYFKIWIVNIFLTVITLYIYSAWAKVRTKRYFYGNTTVDGSSFEYHARGGQLVVGRLIAAALLITYTVFQGINVTISLVAFGIFVLLFPWAIWRSLRFNARATSFRNIRFGFDGNAAPPYLNIIVIPAITIALLAMVVYFINQQIDIPSLQEFSELPQTTILFIAVAIILVTPLLALIVGPLLHKNLISYSHNNHRYGTARLSAKIKTGRVYGIHLVGWLLLILSMAAISAMIFGVIKFLLSFPPVLNLWTQLNTDIRNALTAVGFYLLVIPITGFAVAYFKSSIRNHRYNSTIIDSRVKLRSSTGSWSLWWLNISNLFVLILSLGLAYPYTKIRTARYFASHTTVSVAGGLEQFTQNEKTNLHAMGEEMADAFDMEFDIGI